MSNVERKHELVRSWLALLVTIAAFGLSIGFVAIWVRNHSEDGALCLAYNLVFALLITSFAYGNLLYQATRIGYYVRLGRHQRMTRRTGSQTGSMRAPRRSLSILIPSYKEELVTVKQTLYSAAFLGYGNKTVCLLLDDPVSPPGTNDHQRTQATIAMAEGLQAGLKKLHREYADLHAAAEVRMTHRVDPAAELENLASTYRLLARRLRAMGERAAADTHTDRLYVRTVFLDAATTYERRASDVLAMRLDPFEERRLVLAEYAYIRDLFATEVNVLQRKAFANLSQEPNKAMNINSYISLMGGRFRIDVSGTRKSVLVPVGTEEPADLEVRETDYVITLDADSILDHSYAATLIELMERRRNRRVAVAQTPYSAVAGSNNLLERTAGATTDIQYIIHQGFTHFGATYWVGANALLRKTALDDIAEAIPGEPLVRQYIQDRTVIEDTESTIDLINKRWTLYNHPERLAYSATPNDYGSLLIQRRRWANGGLIILPKLLRYLFLKPSLRKVPEGLMRVHYLASIAMVNISLVVMLFVPLERVGFSIWVPVTAIPYFYLYNRDLRLLGYDRREIFRVYALNLLLIPINLGGVLKSVQQMVTRSKIPFGRTPKVGSHTSAPPLYYLVTYGLLVYLLYAAAVDLTGDRYLFAGLLAVNTYFVAYGIIVFVGLRETVLDMKQLGGRVRRLGGRWPRRALGNFAAELLGVPRLTTAPGATSRRHGRTLLGSATPRWAPPAHEASLRRAVNALAEPLPPVLDLRVAHGGGRHQQPRLPRSIPAGQRGRSPTPDDALNGRVEDRSRGSRRPVLDLPTGDRGGRHEQPGRRGAVPLPDDHRSDQPAQSV
jgi:cellulose synthase (UDP-forming)